MTPFKLHVIWGLILLIIGIVFDFLFVQGKIGQELVRANPPALTSWAKELYDLTKFYLIVLGLLNIALALLLPYFTSTTRIDWTILGLMVIGPIFLIAAGIWYANAGPSYKWELRCTVLTVGLFAIVIGLGLELYKLLLTKNP